MCVLVSNMMINAEAVNANSQSWVQLWLTSDKFSSKHFTAKLFTPYFLLLFIAWKFMMWNNSDASLQYLECALNLLKPNQTGQAWFTIIISIVKLCPRHGHYFVQKFANRIQDSRSFNGRFLCVFCVIKYENPMKAHRMSSHNQCFARRIILRWSWLLSLLF